MKDVAVEDIFTLDPEEVLWEAKHKKSLNLIHFFNQPSAMETLLASLQNDNKPFVLCEMLERKRTSESPEEREAIDCKIKAAHISGELLVTEAQQGGIFNEENVIDYLLTQDSCHFVDCIINRLHQDGMLCFLRSFVWLLSPYSAKSKEEPTEPRIMAADTFHQVWAHSIQLLTELTLISLRHLTGNLRPLKAVEEVIASPWLRQFFTLTFSLSGDDDYIPGIFLMTKLLKHEAVKLKARRGTNNSTTAGSADGDQRRELDVVPSPLARHTAAHIDHIADILRGPADLFFGFVCNNIAQNIIRSTIVTLFSTTGPVQVKLMVLQDAGLLKRIVEANAGNEEDIRKNAGRRGYMGAITQIASALVNCATNEEDVRLAMQNNHEWNAYVMGTLAATCELQESINECYQPPEKNPASSIASRGLMKAARLADNATAVNGMSRKPIITSAAAAKPSAAPTARASSAIAEAIRKAREEKRATARAAGGRAKHGFRRGSKDRSSSFPEVELFIPASMASTSAADNITGPGGEAEQASNGHCQEDNVAVEGEANGTGSQDEKENARDHQCLNGQNSV
ncbi:uncharacterized protein ACA1_061970 [Acanthamoeba castellanii str. Neff]|uniref:Uncharacterized protein n=1 Tax=Acanthamoeba castellanii (strain ATCC 30010 / Neff) TaxID=1257118 RepID=L8GWS9_ACACF|nr:uncharacterized protein ACA1_061970 [Acanthamoeba castellanii str. Neff]ELR17455.1 hypothetical protein ACA1_061970 [Acanthamoeba castellanii str. Neff]